MSGMAEVRTILESAGASVDPHGDGLAVTVPPDGSTEGLTSLVPDDCRIRYIPDGFIVEELDDDGA